LCAKSARIANGRGSGAEKLAFLMAAFIAIARRDYDRFTASDFTQDLLDAEAEQACRLYSEGVFRQVWGHTSPAGAVILIEAESLDAAHAALGTLPLAARGMLQVEVLTVGPYRGFFPRG
jgi:muconolactone delta-isomerase